MTGWRAAVLVGLGGFVGSVARYWIATAATAATPWTIGRVPVGTAVVNMIGCFAIGVVTGAGSARGWLDDATRLLIVTGLLGGFTTYSAFAAETLGLARGGAWGWAAGNVLVQVTLGLALVWLGSRIGTALA